LKANFFLEGVDYYYDVGFEVFCFFSGGFGYGFAKDSAEFVADAFAVLDVLGCFEFVFPLLN